MGTKLKRRKKTRKEKMAESKGKMPKRLVKELNEMEVKDGDRNI